MWMKLFKILDLKNILKSSIICLFINNYYVSTILDTNNLGLKIAKKNPEEF